MAVGSGATLVSPLTNSSGGARAIDSEHNISGGRYVLSVVSTAFNGGNLSLQYQGPDGTTWLDCGANTTMTANGNGYADLPSCRVRLHLASGSLPTALYASLSRVNS